MAKTKEEKRKAKRKLKQKESNIKQQKKRVAETQQEKLEYLYLEYSSYREKRDYERAVQCLKKASVLNPRDANILRDMYEIGRHTDNTELEYQALYGLYSLKNIEPGEMYRFCHILDILGKSEEAVAMVNEFFPILNHKNMGTKKERDSLQRIAKRNQHLIDTKKLIAKHAELEKILKKQKESAKTPQPIKTVMAKPPAPMAPAVPQAPAVVIPEISFEMELDRSAFISTLSKSTFNSKASYDLAIKGHTIRFQEAFDNLICLYELKGIRSLWHQEETARKILKQFRGRALLADEVGLGKTIEALMVFKEYVQRGMVKNALILTPTPLVSQWKEELKSKFDFDMISTDDPEYRSKGSDFWDEPFVISSINLAKSKKNYDIVTSKEYDMVIVDEAHHLKNKTTLNWKLVNALKKRFLLLLTATPVENNLLELYNLITLLKPGQLKTATSFKEEFMTKGDPTDPRNREKLKELLGQVMIRNTRSVVKLDIPLRFAQTVRIETGETEKTVYEQITGFVQAVQQKTGASHRLLLKNFLEEAGSSPRAVALGMERLIGKAGIFSEHEKTIKDIVSLCRSTGDTGKNRMVLKLIKSQKGKFLIFVKYLGTLDHVSEFLDAQKIPYALFHGSMNNAEKDRQIKDFQESKDILLTTEAGGEGRNLQFCHQMINYDLPWNPMKIEQRIGRLHRIGQKNEVRIYNLCAAGSLEEYMLEILDKKINMFEMVIGEIDMVLGRIQGEQDFDDMLYDIWIGAASEKERKESFDQLATKLKRMKTGYQKTRELDEKLFGENYEL